SQDQHRICQTGWKVTTRNQGATQHHGAQRSPRRPKPMSVMASRPILRWALPAGVVVAVLGGGVISNQLRAAANVTLPDRSPVQLMVDVQSANLPGVSGTVVEKADLGLPALPDSIGGDGSSQLNSLISGSHTLRVWYSGPEKTRVALLGAVGESDIIRNGN